MSDSPPHETLHTPTDKRYKNCKCDTKLSCDEFMKTYINTIFDPDITEIPPLSGVKEEFNKFCLLACGRKEFARHLTNKRVNSRCVCENVFLQLVANFVTILHFCAEEDDIDAAKILMILAFTFQCEGKFLYEEILTHPIWQSMRFWNAAFLHAVHTERKLRMTNTKCFSDQTEEQRNEANELQRNIFFGQMTSFITNMKAFDLNSNLITEFTNKMLVVQDLEPEQCEMLLELTTEETVSYNSEETRSRDLSFSSLDFSSLEAFKTFGRSLVNSISKRF